MPLVYPWKPPLSDSPRHCRLLPGALRSCGCRATRRLIALTRRGHHGAFEALVQRYQPRLLAFCRHMLGSQEDAEDVLQEVFTAAFNAMLRGRPPDQRAPVALPDRAQPLAEPPAPPAAGRAGLDGRLRARRRRQHRRHRAQARGVPPDRADVQRAAGDAAHRPAPARDRRALVRPDRRGDGHHRAEREVAARARARVAGRGRRGAAAHLRGGPARARPGGRGARADDRAGAAPPEGVRPLPHLPRRAAQDRRGRWRRSIRSGRSIFLKKLWVAKVGVGGARRAPAAAAAAAAPAGRHAAWPESR